MRIFRTIGIIRWIFSDRIWRISTDDPIVYLTFDDGPTPELTNKILAILDAYNAKATFFCVGENAEKRPELIRSIQEQGHVVGNHTQSHQKSGTISREAYEKAVQQAENSTSAELFRPPYGRLNYFAGKRLSEKYKIVMWSWLSYDYDRSVSLQKIIKKASRIRKGDVIVLHDNAKVEDRILILLPEILNILKKKGLRSEVISA